MGLALDNNVIILAFVFLFNGLVSQTVFAVFLYILFIGLAALNVAPIRTPKFSGRWYYILIVYSLVLTVVFSWRLLHPSG
jgi:CDP-diacylglycerol--serine O-phosphatidyltransferase